MSRSTLLHGIDMTAPGAVDQLLTFHRTQFGDCTMTAGPTGDPQGPPPPGQQQPPPAPPERPDGVNDAEWAALGDPGKAALVRERDRATAAERALAAARTTPPRPTPPPTPPTGTGTPRPETPRGPDGQPDIAALIQQAVRDATAPLIEAQATREAEQAAGTIRDAVTTAASTRFHDATDALTQVDLTTLTDGTGRPDAAKIKTALDELLTRKPHLGKVVDDRRHANPGDPIGAGGTSTVPLDDRVKATLARMQATSGVKFAQA